MNDIKEKYNDIKQQIELLQDMKIGDKIYFYNGKMYLQSSTIFTNSVVLFENVGKYIFSAQVRV